MGIPFFAKSIAICILLLVVEDSQCKPGDSVDSGRLRRNSRIEIGSAEALKFSPLYEEIFLGSQTEGDYFVDYGPFVNRSTSIVKIALNHRGGANHDGIVASVDGAIVARDNRHISFVAMPGQIYGFSVKDHASISVYSTNARAKPSELGLPSAEDFRHPIGEFYKCFQISIYDPISDIVSYDAVYTYIPGSMSDSSTPINGGLWNGFLIGAKPPFDVACSPYSE